MAVTQQRQTVFKRPVADGLQPVREGMDIDQLRTVESVITDPLQLCGEMNPCCQGAIEAVRALKEKYDLYILSTAPWMNPSAWSDKVKWVQHYFDSARKEGVFYKRLILCHHKDMLIRPGVYLIDDRPNHGAELFGDHWLQMGSDRFPDWERVVQYLM